MTPPGDFTTVPVVDVSALVAPDASDADKQAVADAMDAAFRQVGFMYISGHGVDAGLYAEVRALARAFFLQDAAVKERIAIDRQTVPVRGYQRVGDNITGGHADWHEAVDFYRDLPAHHRLRSAAVPDPMHAPNQWPDRPARFAPVLQAYVDRMLQLGVRIMEGVARALRLPPGYFAGFYDESYWVMRAIYYPAMERLAGLRQPDDFGCGVHTDYGCLTFINCDDVRGALQVQNRQGRWVDADPIPGAFIVNVGDMLSKWTGGLYRSTPHRVRSVPGSDRVSIPFFFEPNYDARIVPLFGKNGDDAGVVFGQHLSKRVLSNFKYSPNLDRDNRSRHVD